MEDKLFGCINIYKPTGMTSHDVVSVLRRLVGIKQIGHTGTLDPFAEGVLLVCIGKATRLIEYMADDKAYIGTLHLGKTTTTYDTEGEVVKTSDKKVSLEEIKIALENFKGEIEQLPPKYSAIKVKGKKLYEYARKGEEVEIKPRKVTINELRIENFDQQNQTLELYIDCSKGTYIRSIANDLGEVLGTGGYLTKLVRIKAGKFRVEGAVKLDDLKSEEDVEKNLIYPLEYLDYPKYELNEAEKEKVSHGISVDTSLSDGVSILTYSGKIAAVCKIQNGKSVLAKVFI